VSWTEQTITQRTAICKMKLGKLADKLISDWDTTD
jgi:hypothetical protein